MTAKKKLSQRDKIFQLEIKTHVSKSMRNAKAEALDNWYKLPEETRLKIYEGFFKDGKNIKSAIADALGTEPIPSTQSTPSTNPELNNWSWSIVSGFIQAYLFWYKVPHRPRDFTDDIRAFTARRRTARAASKKSRKQQAPA